VGQACLKETHDTEDLQQVMHEVYAYVQEGLFVPEQLYVCRVSMKMTQCLDRQYLNREQV